MILSNNTYYTNLETLKEFIEDRGIVNSPSLLIQVFTSNNSETFVSRLTKELSSLLPHSNIIGSTTDGEIMEGKVSVEKTVLSFTSFESTALKVDAIEFEYNEYYSGQTLAKVLFDEQTKLLLSFTNGSNVNAEEFLSGIASINSHVTVAGGMAGDKEFKSTLVFTKDQILSCGAVGVSLGGDQLRIHTDYSFNWHPIGAELVISRAEGSRVYTINGKKAKDIYTYYLGEELASGLPKIGIEFPLIVMRDGIRVARALLSVEEDGSFVVAGNLYTGEKFVSGSVTAGRSLMLLKKQCLLLQTNQLRQSFSTPV